MELEWPWLLVGLPIAFALGWIASRLDLRQWRRDRGDAQRAHYEGLNLLLNEQPDKAIDAFIGAVQHDPDTTDLHFALGNLFRRRGEYERAVRVHEHLLGRADLSQADRFRAQRSLAQDFTKAGLFDRAEPAWQRLLGSDFDDEARRALLSLHEHAHDWARAVDVARGLDTGVSGSFATRLAHYRCEQAEEAQARGDEAAADAFIAAARAEAPEAPRPWLLQGARALRRGDADAALQAWDEVRRHQPGSFALVASRYAEAARRCGPARVDAARRTLEDLQRQRPSVDLLRALGLLDAVGDRDGDAADDGDGSAIAVPPGAPKPAPGAAKNDRGVAARARVIEHLRRQPALAAAQLLVEQLPAGVDAAALRVLAETIGHSAAPLQRYRCAACGFEAQPYFWQCPGCLNWDSYPTDRIDAL